MTNGSETETLTLSLPRDLRDRFFAAVPEDQRDTFVAEALVVALSNIERKHAQK